MDSRFVAYRSFGSNYLSVGRDNRIKVEANSE